MGTAADKYEIWRARRRSWSLNIILIGAGGLIGALSGLEGWAWPTAKFGPQIALATSICIIIIGIATFFIFGRIAEHYRRIVVG